MNVPETFFEQALAQIARGVILVMGGANLQVRAEPLPRRTAQKVSGRLRHLEHLLRRVLILMALRLLPALMDRQRVETGPPPRPRASKPRLRSSRGFSFLPGHETADWSGGAGIGTRATGPVPVEKLLSRIIHLQAAIGRAEAHAGRLAGCLLRRGVAGQPPPCFAPQGLPNVMGAELGLIAAVLPMHLARAALAIWPDTS